MLRHEYLRNEGAICKSASFFFVLLSTSVLCAHLPACQTTSDGTVPDVLSSDTLLDSSSSRELDAEIASAETSDSTEILDLLDTESANEGDPGLDIPNSPQPTDTQSPDLPIPDTNAPDTNAPDTNAPDTNNNVEIAAPSEVGKYEIKESAAQLDLPGAVFGKSMDVVVFSPAESGPFPAVILNHGFMLSPDNYVKYAKHLASWGYVVAMPEFPGSIIAPSTDIESRDAMVSVLDWLETQSNVDAAKIAAAGHSRGGKISLFTAVNDSRIKAVFGIDPVDSTGPSFLIPDPTKYVSVTPELMPQINVPMVLVGETTNSEAGIGGQACAPAEDNFHQYYLHAVAPVVEIEVIGANHMSFLDNPNCGLPCSVCSAAKADTGQTHLLTVRYFTAFLNWVLKGQKQYKSFLTGPEIESDKAQGFVLFQTKNSF